MRRDEHARHKKKVASHPVPQCPLTLGQERVGEVMKGAAAA